MYISTSWCKKLAVQQDPQPGIETSNHGDASGKMGWNGCMSQLDPWLVFSKMCFFTFLGCSWGDGFTTGKSTFSQSWHCIAAVPFGQHVSMKSQLLSELRPENWAGWCFIPSSTDTSLVQLGSSAGGFSGGLRGRTAVHSYVSLLDITWFVGKLTWRQVLEAPQDWQLEWSQSSLHDMVFKSVGPSGIFHDIPWYSFASWHCPNNVLLVKIEGPVRYTIYHHLPAVKGVNKPLY